MKKADKAPASFEAALADLENIIQAMESNQLPLEAALTNYQQGMSLLKFCQAKLTDAEQQVKVLENQALKALDTPNAG